VELDKPRILVNQDDTGVWLIELLGEHDLSTVPDLQRAFDEVFSHGTRILVDLSETTFIDSTTIDTLAQAQQRAEQHEEEKLIVAAPPGSQPAAVFDIVQIRQILSIADNRDAALLALGSEPTPDATPT
jgi:anti-sigma B factor antagonist